MLLKLFAYLTQEKHVDVLCSAETILFFKANIAWKTMLFLNSNIQHTVGRSTMKQLTEIEVTEWGLGLEVSVSYVFIFLNMLFLF